MEAKEIMTADPAVCEMSRPIVDAAIMMEECDCGAIPVVSDIETKKLVGIITDRDIAIRAVAKGLQVFFECHAPARDLGCALDGGGRRLDRRRRIA